MTNTWEPNRDVLDVKENRIPSTNTTISSFHYGVNSIGQRTGVQTTGTAFNSTPADWVWGYDALGQVISADSPTSTFDRAYTYDQIGNRKKSADGALVTTGTTATVYDLNPLNQYSQISVPSVQSVVPIHDQDGNATAYPLPVAPTTNATLAYDGENRLVSVTTGTTTVSYIYDSQSRRIARTEFPLPLGEGQGEGAQHTLYLYDAWNCLAEYSLQNSSFTIHNSFSWGLDLSGSLQGAGGVGGLLSVTKHQAQSTTNFFPTYDGNGNVSEYLTASGSSAAHYEYDPFGRTIVESGPNAADFAYRFSTKPMERVTGLYYYGYRYYDPVAGRWINRDPIEESGGVNLYGFVGNDGIGLIDFLGQSDEFDWEAYINAGSTQHDWVSCITGLPCSPANPLGRGTGNGGLGELNPFGWIRYPCSNETDDIAGEVNCKDCCNKALKVHLLTISTSMELQTYKCGKSKLPHQIKIFCILAVKAYYSIGIKIATDLHEKCTKDCACIP